MATTGQGFDVQGYSLASDRLYDRDTHMWVEPRGESRVRIGFDPLGSETLGDVVQLSFEPVGAEVGRGGTGGQVEAAKFVGPLVVPVSGLIVAHNDEVLREPGLVNEDPGAHWLLELEPTDRGELSSLLCGEAEVSEWFAAEVERFRSRGAIAE